MAPSTDPLNGRPYEPIDQRIVEMMYRKDPGYFLQTYKGCLYHFSHVARQANHDLPLAPPFLSFNLECPKEKLQATYNMIYARWADTPAADGIRMKLNDPKEARPVVRMAVKKAISEARIKFSRGVPIELVKSGMLETIRKPVSNEEATLAGNWENAVVDIPERLLNVWSGIIQGLSSYDNEQDTVIAGPTMQRVIMSMPLTLPQLGLGNYLVPADQRQEAITICNSNKDLFERYLPTFNKKNVSLPQAYWFAPKMSMPPPMDPFGPDMRRGAFSTPRNYNEHSLIQQWKDDIEDLHAARRPASHVARWIEEQARPVDASSQHDQLTLRAPIAVMVPITQPPPPSPTFSELMDEDDDSVVSETHYLPLDYDFEAVMDNARMEAFEELKHLIVYQKEETTDQKCVQAARERTLLPAEWWRD